MKGIKIYCLEKNNIPFYVGKSSNPLHRIGNHKKKFGIDITLEVIDEVEENEWKFWEKHWIEQFKAWGFKLENKNNGGGGPNKGRILRAKDNEWRRKIGLGNKNKSRSESTRNKMRLAKLNKPGSFLNHHHHTRIKNQNKFI